MVIGRIYHRALSNDTYKAHITNLSKHGQQDLLMVVFTISVHLFYKQPLVIALCCAASSVNAIS